MEPKQREVLIVRRPELVASLDVEGGLFTQLIAKKVLNQRTVNNIKSKKTPEEQAEELLNFLPKKDCFEKFCEALEADDQDEIVTKYLKAPLPEKSKKKDISETASPKQSASSVHDSVSSKLQTSTTNHSNSESTDSSAHLENTRSTISVVRLKEPDNNHLCIEYQNASPHSHSPTKRIRLADISDVPDSENCTRYVHKHFIAEETGTTVDQTLAIIPVHNPQNVYQNPNISDPSRYLAAYKPHPSQIIMQEESLVPPSMSSPSKLIAAHHVLSNGDPTAKNSSPLLNNVSNLKSRTPVVHPHAALAQAGLLPPAKQPPAPPPSTLDCPDHMTLKIHERDFLQDDSLLGKTIEGVVGGRGVQSVSVPAGGSVDDSIDLPDGCVNVKVEHSTRQFFLANYKKSYPMRRIPRGLFLIINVDEVEGKPPRKGTNFDRDNLMNLLCRLHFDPVVYNDADGLSAQEIVVKLKDFARRAEHYESDACFICLLSHGEEGYIFGTDGKRIPLDEIFLLFGNTNCKGLIGKPKVFIIQACRGGILDKGVRLDEPDGGSVPPPPAAPAAAPPPQLPTMSDMLICYPTMAGYYAWRNRARGSWYIEAIVQVFMKYARTEDICVMLNRVNQVVSRKVSECNQKEMNAMSQMSEFKSSLRQPHLFLFPGIECSLS